MDYVYATPLDLQKYTIKQVVQCLSILNPNDTWNMLNKVIPCLNNIFPELTEAQQLLRHEAQQLLRRQEREMNVLFILGIILSVILVWVFAIAILEQYFGYIIMRSPEQQAQWEKDNPYWVAYQKCEDMKRAERIAAYFNNYDRQYDVSIKQD